MKRVDRFYIPNIQSDPQNTFHIPKQSSPDLFHQFTKVLRLRVGDNCILFTNEKEFSCKLSSIDKYEVQISIESEKTLIKSKPLHFWIPIIHPTHIEELISNCSQIGVTHFHFFRAEYSQVMYEKQIFSEKKMTRLKKLAIEATEQSEGNLVPEIDTICYNFTDLPFGKNMMIAIEREVSSINTSTPLHIAIGPEGGWSPEEKKIILESECTCISLGKNILRAEVAGTVLAYEAVKRFE